MSKRYPGGLITKTPVVPSGSYQTSSAPGVWTLEQQAQYKQQGIWPTAGNVEPTGDPQFNYVTMLLHGDGTNGAQNNTFIDSGPNTYTITNTATTAQGSYGPFGTLWSNYFGGAAGDYLFSPNNASFALGSGDFTVECWFWLDNTSTAMCMFENRPSNTSTGINMFVNYSAAGQVQYRDSSGAPISSSITITAGSWNHYALVRSGSTVTLWINGQSGGTVTKTTNFTDQVCVLGQDQGGGFNFKGFLSNFRMVVGTAVYTSAFTPSTTPLTAITNTRMLTCQSNRYKDNSANNETVSASARTATVGVDRFSPFLTTTAYSTSVIGGSTYFFGGSKLTVASNATFNWGTGDGTMEWWFNAPAQTTNFPGLVGSSEYNSTGSTNVRWDNTGQRSKLFIYINGGGDPILTNTTTLFPNTWNHCAVVRSGNTIYFYVNGVRNGSVTYSGTMNWSATSFYIGKGFDVDGAQANFTGYISNVRNVKGTAVYTTTTYTVPTAPLTAISGTQFLSNMINGAIFDNAMINDLTTAGNAQISTSVFKYGTGSMYFDGAGDYLLSGNTTAGNFGTGDFTIEYWFNAGTQGTCYVPQVGTLDSASADGTWRFGTWLSNGHAGGVFFAYNSGASFTDITFTDTSPNDNTWHHLACTRQNGTVKAFLDGNQVGSSYTVTQNFKANRIVVGAELYSPTYYTGYIDDLRITKGYARYTANFTPPTQAFFNNG
jgi:hypothetical protein